MKTLAKNLILVLFVSLLAGFTSPALAYYPILSVSSAGGSGDVTVSVSGGQSNAQVVLNYTPSGSSLPVTITGTTDYSGNFTTIINGYGFNTSSQIYGTVGGQAVTANYGGNGGGGSCGYYGCSVGGLTLSQTNLSLTAGQSTSVTASYPVYGYNNNIYVSTNSTPSVATATASGNQITVYGSSQGSTTISICANSSTVCASLYVTVSGNNNTCYYNNNYNCGNNNGNVWFNPSSPNLYVGQSLAVSINSASNSSAYSSAYSNAYYISSNSNQNAVSASVSGTVLNLYGSQAGSSTIIVCHNSLGYCGNLYVTVAGSGSGGCGIYGCSGTLTLSQTNLTMTIGQTASVTAANSTGSAIYINSNSNQSAVSASVSGSTINLYASNSGAATIIVCASSSQCSNLYVTVSGSVLGASTAAISIGDDLFSPRNITVNAGTTIVWNNNGGMVHTVTADDNSFNSGSLQPGQNFSRAFNVPGTYAYHCIFHGGSGGSGMSGTITVTGTTYGGSGSVWFNPSTVNLNPGQSTTVTISGNNGNNYNNSYYVLSNSNSGVASASVSGNILNLYAYSNGTATIVVCQSGYSNNCGNLNVTVGGGYYGGGGGGSLYFNTTTLPLMTAGQYYSYQLQANGGNAPYTYTLTSGSLPSGLSLSSSGLISGVAYPSAANFTIRVSDAYGRSATANFSVNGSYSGGGLQYPGGGNVLGASNYPSGELIAEGSTVYIVYKNTKTGFASAGVFTNLGFKFSNVVQVGSSGLTDSGYIVSSSFASHPWGSWIKNGQTIYFVHDSGLVPVSNWNTFVANGGQASWIVNANSADLRLPILSVMYAGDSRLQ